jgi:hypothetical protein
VDREDHRQQLAHHPDQDHGRRVVALLVSV